MILGGQWIGPDHKKMYALLDELGIEKLQNNLVKERLFLCREGKITSYEKASLILEEGYSLKDLKKNFKT